MPLRGWRQGRARPQRRPQPPVHCGGRAPLRGHRARLRAQLHAGARGAAKARRRGGPARWEAVAQGFRRRGGHLLHGGRLLPAARDRHPQEPLQGVPVSGRGALNRCSRAERARRDGALRRPNVRGGCDDGDLHEVVWQRGRVCGGLEGGHQRPARGRAGQCLRRGHGAAVRSAGPAGPARHLGGGRRVSGRGEAAQHPRQLKLLP
mmetsp:Transcript_57889/g.148902  ORF Transcript_57889/g.148902 Transcript_57889/m.148902 type:complete len:206 (+) Transcript_57889:1126-1743(+)